MRYASKIDEKVSEDGKTYHLVRDLSTSWSIIVTEDQKPVQPKSLKGRALSKYLSLLGFNLRPTANNFAT